jgi:S-formylglutathione hydrolase FrmB
MSRLSRRAFLIGAGGVAVAGGGGVLVNDGVLPGRVRAYQLLGLNGDEAPIPKVKPGRRFDGSFVSAKRGGATTGWSVSLPPGTEAAGLPLLVCLHGARADHRTAFDVMGVDRFLAQAVADGVPPFAVASVDGGAESYWHPRADGTDAGAMVTDELLPMVRHRFGFSDRLGLFGWSMGGYGVLRLALEGAGVAAVAALSPALATSYGEAPEGAFDSDTEFRQNDVVGHAGDMPNVPLRIDCGKGDPFYFAVHDFIERLTFTPVGGFEAGAHTYGYMRRMLPTQLAFIGQHLESA